MGYSQSTESKAVRNANYLLFSSRGVSETRVFASSACTQGTLRRMVVGCEGSAARIDVAGSTWRMFRG